MNLMSHRIVYELNEDNFRKLIKTYDQKHRSQVKGTISMWWWLILPSLLVGSIAYIIAREVKPGSESTWAMFGMFISAVLLSVIGPRVVISNYVLSVFRNKMTNSCVNILCRTEVVLEEDRIRVIRPTLDIAHVYKMITRVEYKDDILQVMSKDLSILYISKSVLVSGDLELFVEELNEAVKSSKENLTEIGK